MTVKESNNDTAELERTIAVLEDTARSLTSPYKSALDDEYRYALLANIAQVIADAKILLRKRRGESQRENET